mmetsp:Transcript_37514/g.60061  ORF Transcript_37514/g.60061 Transcript_37514/m.60061 type:complete len:221 (+) Transcript_37514:41-703(+)|eukprot:CAMPEP_0197021378 /NCGR_PEP_ID=MMETSP1384-20130603/2246_1 /TAXON_ID=29189 /ORGANISM="Ammonia sp." /LENGTH=220 /DNA_ID=CAMNT_0042449189 /DNA_START=39 /DNA_END=701 /DNA_ORIENTATION=+
MNIFRLAADMIHLISIFILLIKVAGAQNCRGISLKTQALYCVVFTCRYLDLFWNFWSLYNWVMKLIFIGSSYTIVYYMKYQKPTCKTYDASHDHFKVWILVIPCLILALFFNVSFTPFEILWAFSIYLESVSILPQLIMVQKYARDNQGTVQNITSHYVFCLGAYRALYLINWIYRYLSEPSYYDPIAWVSGVVQTLLYIDFFYYYVKAATLGKVMELPV